MPLQASPVGLLGSFAPSSFALHPHIFGCLIPLSYGLRTRILSCFAPSGFALRPRVLGCFAPSSFALCALISLALLIHVLRFALTKIVEKKWVSNNSNILNSDLDKKSRSQIKVKRLGFSGAVFISSSNEGHNSVARQCSVPC